MFHVLTRISMALFLITACITELTAAGSMQAPRTALVERAIATGEAAIANPKFVAGEAWFTFTEIVRDPEVQALDDEQFHRAFNEATDGLPFTHFRLHWQPGVRGGASPEEPAIHLSWPSEDVALVKMRMFEGDPSVISDTMNEVMANGTESLIIDLRGTPGGSFPTAVALSRALRRESIDAGAFLTRGWFAQHGDYPDAEQYAGIPALEVLDLGAFAAQLQRDGAARLILPAHDEPIFEGRLVILTDSDTASTCEPLVYLLQRQGVTVIGERTFGGMLSAEHFPMDETFRLFVPVADYVTPELTRLDRVGVQPNIQVPAEQALERAMAWLQESAGS
ncbi:MAG: S41 family peptidase [Pseudomonadota bacterium]